MVFHFTFHLQCLSFDKITLLLNYFMSNVTPVSHNPRYKWPRLHNILDNNSLTRTRWEPRAQRYARNTRSMVSKVNINLVYPAAGRTRTKADPLWVEYHQSFFLCYETTLTAQAKAGIEPPFIARALPTSPNKGGFCPGLIIFLSQIPRPRYFFMPTFSQDFILIRYLNDLNNSSVLPYKNMYNLWNSNI